MMRMLNAAPYAMDAARCMLVAALCFGGALVDAHAQQIPHARQVPVEQPSTSEVPASVRALPPLAAPRAGSVDDGVPRTGARKDWAPINGAPINGAPINGAPIDGERGAPTHWEGVGRNQRPLWIDGPPFATAQRAGDQGRKALAGSPAGSPLFRDQHGNRMALPGGVVVRLARDEAKNGFDESGAREQLNSLGLSVRQRIGKELFLVDAPAGLASLELANRLAADPRFAEVHADWWQETATR